MKNLTYQITIEYTNDFGKHVLISKKFHDNGLEENTTQVDNICITEETIQGRVLSGKYSNGTTPCGYRYDYEKYNNEYLTNINPTVPLNKAVDLINKTKMNSEFLSAKMVLSSLMRKDYKVVSLKSGTIDMTKTISATTENAELCLFQESISMTKDQGQSSFVHTHTKTTYQISDRSFSKSVDHQKVTEQAFITNNIGTEASLEDYADTKSKLDLLTSVAAQNPTNYKELNAAVTLAQQSSEQSL